MRASAFIAASLALVLGGCAASPAPHPIVAAAPPAPAEPPPVDAPSAAPQAAPAASAQTQDDERATLGTEDSHHESRQRKRAYGWVAISAGTISTGIAIGTSFMMLHQASIRSGDCADKVCSPAGLIANQQLDNMAAWNAGAWVLGAVGLGAGIVLLLTNPSDKGLQAEVGATPSGVLLRGAF